MKKWEILSKLQIANSKWQIDDLIKLLLKNRGIKAKKEIDEFLNPKLENVTVQSVGINKLQLQKSVSRIKKAIKNGEQIVVFGDYDVDGICGTAILWETLNQAGAKVLPYIPHRIDEGYGISLRSIVNIKNKISNIKLIITVDNGIVANEPVDFANKLGIDVIITDHHVPVKLLPKAYSIVHTTKICGAGVAYLLALELRSPHPRSSDSHLELAALATVADLVPLIGPNRAIVKFGIEALRNTKRIGLLELFKEGSLNQKQIDTYQIGHIIAPRLNAMGRMESGMDSLRLLCTTKKERAQILARELSSTNLERQSVTTEAVIHAKAQIVNNGSIGRLLFMAHESYQQGVIGLVASKLVEEYYVPSIVISKGEQYSKASARSIHGFNIIEFIRSASEFLVDAGGHPMAAGFTVETAKLELLQKRLLELAQKKITKKMLTQSIRIDCELPLDSISFELYDELQKLSPFGMGNPTPIFMSKNVAIEDMRLVGQDAKHLRLKIKDQKSRSEDDQPLAEKFKIDWIDGIWFGGGERAGEFHIGDKVDLVYTIDQDLWNGNRKLQLKLKDIRKKTQ